MGEDVNGDTNQKIGTSYCTACNEVAETRVKERVRAFKEARVIVNNWHWFLDEHHGSAKDIMLAEIDNRIKQAEDPWYHYQKKAHDVD